VSHQDVCKPLGGEGGHLSEREIAERLSDFEEVFSPLDAKAVKLFALRCLGAHFCKYCEVCQMLCPDLCITRDPETFEIRIDLDHCKGCGLCAHFCPKGAIQMEIEPAS
jgi:Pyruvate/2-oxoacid:ferredoxin oxidoreductase delta subunit